ncbi:hypothetical protein CFC21_010186 [Triticum aestivum]|uniref:NB-ARC domain-containing protein n=2 Tax=Triticum aestivum TaxID=4565 RepID=A0A9R1IU97_WHEAT|nr:disease resistance protein Pikm1-TS-like [Triticum aestivum]KAF6993270.1 hypothetical protein CFC21_010186 [Triticum aestivum]
MAEVQELSYDMEDDIDDFVNQKASQISLEQLKTRVKNVSRRSCEMQKAAEATSNCSKPAIVDPRSRFLHSDPSELVGMEALKDDLFELVAGGVDTLGDAGEQHSENISFKVQMPNDKLRSMALATAARIQGVRSKGITGTAGDILEVVGCRIDVVELVTMLRKKLGGAQITKVERVKKNLPAVAARQRPHQIKTICIHGLPGVGKTALADLVYSATEEQFDCRAFVSVSPSPDITEVLRAIVTQVTNSPVAYTGAVTEQYLLHELSKFLVDKRYLVIIDDIWHWEELQIIAKSLPKNNPSSRIVITTRISAIAEKCLTDDMHTLLYKIGGLDVVDAWTLMKSGDDNAFYGITEMCDGMPLAIICISLAMKEQTKEEDGDLGKTRVLRRVKDGILTIPSLKPLAESLCLGYKDLPLYLRTFLLYCSIYSCRHKFEKDRLVRRWIAERLVYQEETAEGYFDDLVDREWIKPVASGKHEIHPVMLAFLKCKSQEDNLVTHLDFCSDISPCKQIRRLSLQGKKGQSMNFSALDLSHTHSLAVFGSVSGVPFKRFERLRVLELEDTEGLENAHLVDICGLLWLRHIGLMGTPITEVPFQIKSLLHLETLDIRDTGVMELPWEACQLPKSVRVLAGSKDSRQGISLPEGVHEDLENGIPDSSMAKCREVLSILLIDPFGLGAAPQFAAFKVPGRCMHIPELIKEYFKILSSLDIRLFKLEEDDIKFLQEMPNLKILVVRFEVVPVEPVTINAVGFAMLESFGVDSRVPRVTFEQGAMPKLRRLAFKIYNGPESKNPLGITHLRRLEVVVFRCSPWYGGDSPGISTTVAIVRREAWEHPNQITLCINDYKEIFPERKSALAQVCEESGSSRMGGVDVQADIFSVSAARNSIASIDATASCSQTSEIEEVKDQWYSYFFGLP